MDSLWGLGAAGFALLTGFTILGPSVKGRLGGTFACAIIAIVLLTQAPHAQANWAGRLAGEGLAGGLALALLARAANAINRGADAWKIWKASQPQKPAREPEPTYLVIPPRHPVLRRVLLILLAMLALSTLTMGAGLAATAISQGDTGSGITVLILTAALLAFYGWLYRRNRLCRQLIAEPAGIAPKSAESLQQAGPASQSAPPVAPSANQSVVGQCSILARDLALPVMLRYRDPAGHETSRRVTVDRLIGGLDRTGSAVVLEINGFCHLRRQPRSFMLGRILELADAETGEIIADPSVWLLAKAADPTTSCARRQ